MSISAIPTIGPKSIQFRSRLEAQWAYMFEEFKWKWEYEPIDLLGYIPDFIIDFPKHKILVEIKPETVIPRDPASDCPPTWKVHIDKIIKSGWEGDFLILGASYDFYTDDWMLVGIGGYILDQESLNSFYNDEQYYLDSIHIRKYKDVWQMGGNVRKFDIGWCQNDNDNETNYYWKHSDNDTLEAFETVWVNAKNAVQWKGQKSKKINKVID